MKNKFKKIQLATRKTGKKGIIFGATFALTLIGLSICVPKLGIHADPAETIDEIRITSSTVSVQAGELPEFEVTTTTEHVSLEAYGSNTGWSKWESGYSDWSGFGEETPTAIDDGSTHYGLRILVQKDNGYSFSETPSIYFNDVDITGVDHTLLDQNFDLGGYLYIDLGTANSTPDVSSVVVHTIFFGEGGTYNAQYTPVASEEASQVGIEKNTSGFFTVASGDDITFTATPSQGYAFKGWYATNADQTCSLDEPITCEQLSTNPIFAVTPEGNPYYAPLFEETNQFNRDDYAMIEIGGGATEITEADGDDDTVTVTFANGTLAVTGTNLYSDTTMNANNRFEIYALGNVTLTATPNENYNGDLRENGNLLGTNTVEYTGLVAGDMHIVDVEFTEQGGGQDPVVPALEDIEFDLSWTNTFVNVWINNISVVEESDDYQSTSFTYTGVVVPEAGTTIPEENNVIRLQPRFGDLFVTEYNINGVNYTEDNSEVTVDDGGCWFVTLPGAAKYTITGVGDSGIAVPRTIIWANVDADTSAEEYEEDMRLEHGKAKVIAIYDGETEVAGETDVDADGMGWVQVTPGNNVVFEFVPEYGYQLTEVSANGLPLEPQDTMNQYIFEMPNTNVHFSATFERVEDVVEANSEKVTSGSIAIGGALQGGTAQLTVNDIELSSDKIAGFENAAGDYAISSYLDIDLYNIFYKANSNEDAWSDKIDELDQEVTITIQLAEGIDANDIVIVHNIHDGEEYEIIPIDSYDPSTNTITFKTRSFSSYAIAERTTEEESTKSDDSATAATTPNTGASTSSESLTATAISGTVIASIILVGITALYIKKKTL